LELTVFLATVPRDTPAPEAMRWTPRAQLSEEALPGSMRKVLAHALGPLPQLQPDKGAKAVGKGSA
jgi:A/G-specific adenine glycosylase